VTEEKMMKVVVVEKENEVSIREVSMPTPLPGEVLIRIDHCLLCTWEQRMYAGVAKMNFPFIPGHEVAGEIVYIPELTATSFTVGDKVTMKTLDSCGHCEACYRGDDNLCTEYLANGFMMEFPQAGVWLNISVCLFHAYSLFLTKTWIFEWLPLLSLLPVA